MRMLRVSGAAAVAVLAVLPLLSAPAWAGDPVGTVTGVITHSDGTPSSSMVTVQAVDDSWSEQVATDDASGRYTVADVPPGQYQISYYDNIHIAQWIHGATDRSQAAVFTVAAGATVEADDQWLPGGTVRVTIGDSLTGKPVPAPCATVQSTPNPVQACGKNGLVVLNDVPPGDWDVAVSAGASYFTPDDPLHVTVKRSKTSKLITTLEPGEALKTKVVDASTGAPVGDICVNLVDTDFSGQSPGELFCSNDDGTVALGPFTDARTVNLYASQLISPWFPAPAVRYGDQWVGPKGGTGDARKARKVSLQPHVTITVPPIRMDPAGDITGTITDASTGQPVGGICAFPYAAAAGSRPQGTNCSNSTGKYTIEGVGPYSWPVEFAPSLDKGLGWQWSGGVADRFAATYTAVPAGGSVIVDGALVKSATLAGTLTRAGVPDSNQEIRLFNQKTHDYAGPSWSYPDHAGNWTISGYRGQKVWVRFTGITDGRTCWYGTTAGAPTPVQLTDGQTTQLPIDADANCAPTPTR